MREPGLLDIAPVRFLRNFGRGREIATVLFNHGFGDVVERLQLMRYLRWWRRVVLKKKDTGRRLTRPQRIRKALEELGPTYVKFGQVLSTRPDLVPAEVIRELALLQENVPPFPVEQAVALIEDEFNSPLHDLFTRFDPTPLGSGSLAQVHRAQHVNGMEVAVKVRRPNVIADIERDLSLMAELAILVDRHLPEAEIFDPIGLVSEFARSLRRELNFQREGRTMDEFRRLFLDDATLYVPQVLWDRTSNAVLTMEHIEGLRINDKAGLEAAGLHPARIAANGARIFMKMSFELGVFHGDPHPGNMKIISGGVISLFDYGMIGRLEQEKREQLIDLFLAIVHNDPRKAVEQVLLIGRPFRKIDRPVLQSDLRDFIDSYYGLPLERISIGNLLSDFVNILALHGIRYPADLMLLIRAIITLEGIGRHLDPEFNLATYLAPFVQQQVRDRFQPKKVADKLWHEGQDLFKVFQALPGHVGRTLEKLSNDDLKVQLEHRSLERLITEVDRSSNRVVIGMVMSSLILASALVLRSTGTTVWWITVPAFVMSSFLGVWLIYGVFRSGRL